MVTGVIELPKVVTKCCRSMEGQQNQQLYSIATEQFGNQV